jgi:hypothetical protein
VLRVPTRRPNGKSGANSHLVVRFGAVTRRRWRLVSAGAWLSGCRHDLAHEKERNGVSPLVDNLQSVVDAINDSRGKAGHWPKCFDYSLTSQDPLALQIRTNAHFRSTSFRRLDVWGMAFVSELQKVQGETIETIAYCIPDAVPEPLTHFESFKRRLSYLQINNHPSMKVCLSVAGQTISLYPEGKLFVRPQEEVISQKIKERSDQDKGSLLEKSFQAYLFGKGLGKGERKNDRLAILGEDFFQSKKRGDMVMREFPASSFKGTMREDTRILPKNSVDLVTLNKRGELAVIELKLDDSKLEAIAQIVDYALFFVGYRDRIKKLLVDNSITPRRDCVSCYLVNNHFHDRFDDVYRLYSTENKQYPFSIKKVILGHMTE